MGLPNGGLAQREESFITARELHQGERFGANVRQKVGDAPNPPEDRLQRLVVRQDLLVQQKRAGGPLGNTAQGTKKHNTANWLPQGHLMLTNMENQASEGPLPRQKGKGQAVRDTVEGKSTSGSGKPVRSLRVHTLEHPGQKQLRGVGGNWVIFLARYLCSGSSAACLPKPEAVRR